jgi:4-amino-4-deoxy-L-arabinose transferase-like glycosyltransferase
VKKIYDTKTALIAAFLLGTVPWHIMLSRWSLESNILPFFLLLGVWVLLSCYTTKYSALLLPLSLTVLASAFYSYGVSFIIIPWIILLFWAFNLKTILEHKISFVLSIIVFLVIATPFLLFILDNNILHRTPAFIHYLPFSVPLTPGNRLAQVTGQSTLKDNLLFLTSGFNDGQPWNIMPAFLPLGWLNIPLAAVGIYFSVRRKPLAHSVFLFWLLATLPLFLLFNLDINRANAIYIPLIVFNAVGIYEIYRAISQKEAKTAFVSLILAGITLYNSVFCYEYFRNYNNQISGIFNANFDIALAQTESAARSQELIYISDTINLNYMYVLFYLKADPADFKSHSSVTINYGTYIVTNYRNYYFHHDDRNLALASSYLALLRNGEAINCKSQQVLYSTNQWRVERCFNR